MSARALSLLLLLALAAGAAPEEPARVTLPKSVDFRLANGLRVFLVPNREVPLVRYAVRVAGGSVEDPAGKEGTAALLAAMLAKGAGTRDAAAFQEAVDFVGGSFDTGATDRWLAVGAEFLTENAGLGLDLLADALRRPRLDEAEFAKEKARAVDAAKAACEEPTSMLPDYFHAALFAGHPYARPPEGDEASLAAVGLADVTALGARQLVPARVWLAVAGDFDADAMRKAVEAHFGDWKAEGGPPAPVPPPHAAPQSRVLLVAKPGSLQTYFRFGNVAFDWSDPDYPARYVANTILGGRFTSRLNTALRIESGLSYGASSSFADSLGGAFGAGSFTATATSAEALALAQKVYRGFVEDGITQEELDSARSYLKGQYAPATVETAAQAAGMILALEFDGLPRSVVDGLFPRLDALTLEDVNRVIRDRFPQKALVWAVIGEVEVLRPLVAPLGPLTELPIGTFPR